MRIRSMLAVLTVAGLAVCGVKVHAQTEADELLPTELVGTLVDEAGAPLEGVTLRVFDSHADMLAPPLVDTKTAADGSFSAHVVSRLFWMAFEHPDETEILKARTAADYIPIRMPHPGTGHDGTMHYPIDLGRLQLRWSGTWINFHVTCDGKPVSGIEVTEGRKSDARKVIPTDADGKGGMFLDLRADEGFVLFASGETGGYSGWYRGKAGKPGSTQDVKIVLTKGRATVHCSLVDAAGKPFPVSTVVYLGPAIDTRVDTKLFRPMSDQVFNYVPSYFSFETDAEGRGGIAGIPPGTWHIAAVVDGMRLYPDRIPGATVELKPGIETNVTLAAPCFVDKAGGKPKGVVRVEGVWNCNFVMRSFYRWTQIRRLQGTKKKFIVGTYLVPKGPDQEYFLFPMVPNLLGDAEKVNEFEQMTYEIDCVPVGDYLYFCGGVAETVDAVQCPERWVLSKRVFPTYVGWKCVVNDRQETFALEDMRYKDSFDTYAGHYGWPDAFAERYYDHLYREAVEVEQRERLGK